MTVVYLLLTVVGGIGLGYFWLSGEAVGWLEQVITYALAAMVFGVGMDIGRNRAALARLRQIGWRVLLVPLAVGFGTLGGAALATGLLGMPLKEVLAVGAGFGWYSLSGILIAQLYSVELGTTAFLANVFREVLAFLLIPGLARHVGSLAAIAPGGATTMDSTLPMISKVTDTQTALIAFMSGLILTASVPLLIPFLLAW